MLDMLISMAIFASISVLILQSFDLGTKSLNVTYTESRTQSETREGLEQMMRELRNSNYDQVSVPQANLLQFRVPQIISSEGNITWSNQFEYRLGGLNNEQLLRRDTVSGASTVLANGVTVLQFTKNGNPQTLNINMTVRGTSLNTAAISTNLGGTLEFRN